MRGTGIVALGAALIVLAAAGEAKESEMAKTVARRMRISPSVVSAFYCRKRPRASV